MALFEHKRHELLANSFERPQNTLPWQWWIVFVALILLVGLRYEVGGDWYSYLARVERVPEDLSDVQWWFVDPGYHFLERLSVKLGWGIFGVNLIGGGLFSAGVVVFCRHLPRPWLALAVAVPYLIIVLGMGYSRQGIALGLAMIGIVALGQGHVGKFLFWVLIGATFHKSAVVLLPLAALVAMRRGFTNLLWLVAITLVTLGAYVTLLHDAVGWLVWSYLEDDKYHSEGALIRLTMTALPAAFLLWNRKRFGFNPAQERLWLWCSVAAIGLVCLYFLNPAFATPLDRLGLYLLPLQLLVFSYLPEILGARHGKNTVWVVAVLTYYALVEFVWLHFSNSAASWIPYKFYPFEGLF